MKITKADLLQLIKEETQGEMEFAELEAARQAYLQDPNDDTRHELGLMVEKLVEPLMIDMGLFFEAEAFYNRGDLVFNNRSVDVTINPRGETGGYDVNVSAQVSAMDTDPAFEPMNITLPSMKGVVQFINDKVFSSTGMVGEPEAQTELPLENKMRITRTQLERLVREEISNELEEAHCSSGNRDEDDKATSTKKHDNHPSLKGGQKKKLPDSLQKAIIKKSKMKEAVRQALNGKLKTENQLDEVFGIGKAISKVFGGGKKEKNAPAKPKEKVTPEQIISDEFLEIIKAGGGDIGSSGAEPGDDNWSQLGQHRGAGNANSHAEILLSLLEDPGKYSRDAESIDWDGYSKRDFRNAVEVAKGERNLLHASPFKFWGSYKAARNNRNHPFYYSALTENPVNYLRALQDFVDFVFDHAPGLVQKSGISPNDRPTPGEKLEAANMENSKSKENVQSSPVTVNLFAGRNA
jgi:hypothetical protein